MLLGRHSHTIRRDACIYRLACYQVLHACIRPSLSVIHSGEISVVMRCQRAAKYFNVVERSTDQFLCRRIQFCDVETCILVHTLNLLLPLWAQRLSARYCLLTLTRRSGWDLDHIHLVDDWASTRVGIASSRLGPVRFS